MHSAGRWSPIFEHWPISRPIRRCASALIVAGTRESNAFCAGADLVERTTMSPEERLDHLAGIAALCEELAAFRPRR